MCESKNKTESRVLETNRLNKLLASYEAIYKNITNSNMLDDVEKEIKLEAVCREIDSCRQSIHDLIS